MTTTSRADAKARLSELVDRVAAGESFEITRRGKVVARLVAASRPRDPIDASRLRALAETLSSGTAAADLVHSMRDGDRY